MELLVAYGEERCKTVRGPEARKRFIARDFKEFIRVAGMTHVRTSPYYPQSNGELERYNRTVKTDFRSKCPASLDEARKVVQRFVTDAPSPSGGRLSTRRTRGHAEAVHG